MGSDFFQKPAYGNVGKWPSFYFLNVDFDHTLPLILEGKSYMKGEIIHVSHLSLPIACRQGLSSDQKLEFLCLIKFLW